VGKREEKAIATRNKLINTANQLIVQHGYENISVDAIVRASGIAKGTFYNYFKRKEDLIFELSKQRFALIAAPTEELLKHTPLTNIQCYLVDFMAVIVASKVELARQWIRYVSGSSADHTKWHFDVHSFEQLLMKLIDLKQLKSTTPVHQLAQLLLTQLYGVLLTWCIDPATIDPLVTVNQFCALQLPRLLAPYLLNVEN